MGLTRCEIMPGVWLNHMQTGIFKTACMSITLLTQLTRETASVNALIPYVLRRGTSRSGSMEELSKRMDELYGSRVEPVVRRIGEIQCIGFYSSFPEDKYLPKGADVLKDNSQLMGEMLLSPATRGGLLLPEYVDSEKEKLLERIRSRVNDKRGYSVQRCIEEMCCCEDFAVSRFGSEDEAEDINYKKLTRQYRALLQSCPVEIFYCGKESVKKVGSALKDAFITMPRGSIDYDIGTDVRMNALEAQPRYVEEVLDVTQAKLVIGFRLGECMEEPNIAALHVFNCLYGGGTTSKLFTNVRERLSLCYYASSVIDIRKGLLLVASGIDFDAFEPARNEILAQLDAIKRGEITDDEFNSAKSCVASDLRATMDSQGELEGFYLANALDGLEYGPLELAELVEDVTREDIIGIADSIECDLVYFLAGSGEYKDAEAEDGNTEE